MKLVLAAHPAPIGEKLPPADQMFVCTNHILCNKLFREFGLVDNGLNIINKIRF